MWRDEPHLAENGKTQVKTFNEVEKIPDKIQIKLNFLKTPQTLFNIPKLSINYHKFSLSLLMVFIKIPESFVYRSSKEGATLSTS